METSGVTAEEMAVDLGVHINSVYNYISGRREPKLGMIKQWAFRTGVPYVWIIDGFDPGEGAERDVSGSGCTVLPFYTRSGLSDSVAS